MAAKTEKRSVVQTPTAPAIWPKVSGASIAAISALLYVIGFVVANVHFARYELLRLELLQPRYLAAGLLFLLVCGSPLMIGVMFAISSEDHDDDSRRVRAVWQLPLGLALSFGYGVAVTQVPEFVVGEPRFGAWGLIGLMSYEMGRHLLVSDPKKSCSDGRLQRRSAELLSGHTWNVCPSRSCCDVWVARVPICESRVRGWCRVGWLDRTN